VGWQSEYQVNLLASISCPLSSPTLNSRFQLGLQFLQAKCNTLAISPLFPFSPLPNSHPVPYPDPVPRHSIQFRRPQHTLYSIFRLPPQNHNLLICLTLLHKDPAVLHRTLSKLALLKEFWTLSNTDLHCLWRSRQSYRLQHPWCLQSTLKGNSCSHLTPPTQKKTRMSLLQFTPDPSHSEEDQDVSTTIQVPVFQMPGPETLELPAELTGEPTTESLVTKDYMHYQDQIQLMETLHAMANCLAMLSVPLPPAPPAPVEPKFCIKLRSPDTFNGSDPGKLDAFIFQCSIYIVLRRQDFLDEASKVAFM